MAKKTSSYQLNAITDALAKRPSFRVKFIIEGRRASLFEFDEAFTEEEFSTAFLGRIRKRILHFPNGVALEASTEYGTLRATFLEIVKQGDWRCFVQDIIHTIPPINI